MIIIVIFEKLHPYYCTSIATVTVDLEVVPLNTMHAQEFWNLNDTNEVG